MINYEINHLSVFSGLIFYIFPLWPKRSSQNSVPKYSLFIYIIPLTWEANLYL